MLVLMLPLAMAESLYTTRSLYGEVGSLEFQGVSSSCSVYYESAYKAGILYVSGDLVNLRQQPSTSAKILMELPLGTIVEAKTVQKQRRWEEEKDAGIR